MPRGSHHPHTAFERSISYGIAGFALLLAAAGPAAALPVFTAGWGLNTINAPFDAALTENTPVSGGNSRTTRWFFDPALEFYTVTASADANRGVVGVLASISVARNIGYQTARVESIASMQGTVNLCAPGGAPGVCAPPAPGVPVPIPYPNFHLTTNQTQTDAHSLASLTARVSISATGNAAGVSQDVVSLNVLGPHSNSPFGPDSGATTGVDTTTGAFTVKFDLAAIVSCSTTGCVSAVDASHSLGFVEGAPAFLGLPDGWSVWSQELNIADNRWTDPRTPSEPPSADAPAPATLPLILAGLAAFAARRRCRERLSSLGEVVVGCSLA